MLLFVLHLLGDLLEIGSRSCELRRLSVLQQDFQGPQRVLFLRASSALQTLCIGQVLPNLSLRGGALKARCNDNPTLVALNAVMSVLALPEGDQGSYRKVG